MGAARRPKALILRIALVVVAALAFAIRMADAIQSQTATGGWFIDWRTYSNAVERWLSGYPIYGLDQVSGPYFFQEVVARDYAYPPASIPLMVPFAPDPFGLIAWEALLIGALLAAIWVIAGRGFPHRRIEAFAVALLAAACFYPITQGIAAGNVNIATAALLAWAWTGMHRPGVVAGIFAIEKVFPIGIAVLYGRRAVIVAVLTAIAVAVITLPLVGLHSWSDFVVSLQNALPTCPNSILNLSVACTLQPALGLRGAEFLSLAIAAGLLLIGAATGPTLIGIVAIGAAIMVPAADLHLHYWSFAFIALFIAVARIARRRRGEAPDPAWRPFRERWGFGPG